MVFYLTPAVLSVSRGRCYYWGVPCSASLCRCPVLLWVNQDCFHSGNLVWILMILSQWRYLAASIRPGTRFDQTSSQFMWTANEKNQDGSQMCNLKVVDLHIWLSWLKIYCYILHHDNRVSQHVGSDRQANVHWLKLICKLAVSYLL